MRVGPLSINFHRTIRVADGRTPANLPPSLGEARLTPVSQYRQQCPEAWEDGAYFIPLHDTEALWISLSSSSPVAALIGAGGVNVLTGEKLGLTLEASNYMVVPPQPWIDGFKSTDGNVYQFVATPYKGGEGLSVGEQILGAESKSGGIGIAVFEPKGPLIPKSRPYTGKTAGAYGDLLGEEFAMKSVGVVSGMSLSADCAGFDEMGVGKGGLIKQKIYADPHGLEAWKEEPVAITAFYLVNAQAYKEITGIEIPAARGQEGYDGPWFGQADDAEPDVPGAAAFTGLKTVFPGAS